jgi:hypothetical protein
MRLQSYRFSRVIQHFYLVQGMPLDRKRIGAFVDSRLMLMAVLSPLISYQRAAHIDEHADARPRARSLCNGRQVTGGSKKTPKSSYLLIKQKSVYCQSTRKNAG